MNNHRKTALIALSVLVIIGLIASWPPGDKSSDVIFDSVKSRIEAFPETLNSSDGSSDKVTTDTTDSTFGCTADFDVEYQELGTVAAALSKSSNPEHLLIAALYWTDRTDGARIDAIARALQSDPDNPLITWNFLHTCSQFPDAPMCVDQKMEQCAIDVDRSNGRLWTRIAEYRARRGDMQGALTALNEAVVAPRFTDYRMEHIAVFERGLAASGNPPYRQRIIEAIGIQAALASNEFRILTVCENMAGESSEWLSLFTRLGVRLEQEGRSVLFVSSGQRLQQTMYSISGDYEKEALVAQRINAIRHYWEPIPHDGQVLLSRDDQVFASYVAAWGTHGEINALEFLNSEVERLKNEVGYDPCTLRSSR